jgi:hypothetical protein
MLHLVETNHSTDAGAIFWLIPSPGLYLAKLLSARGESINVVEECEKENNP